MEKTTIQNLETLSRRLRLRREELGLNQEEVALIAGISRHSLSNLETGKGNPTLSMILEIVDVLGLSLSLGPKELRMLSSTPFPAQDETEDSS